MAAARGIQRSSIILHWGSTACGTPSCSTGGPGMRRQQLPEPGGQAQCGSNPCTAAVYSGRMAVTPPSLSSTAGWWYCSPGVLPVPWAVPQPGARVAACNHRSLAVATPPAGWPGRTTGGPSTNYTSPPAAGEPRLYYAPRSRRLYTRWRRRLTVEVYRADHPTDSASPNPLQPTHIRR